MCRLFLEPPRRRSGPSVPPRTTRARLRPKLPSACTGRFGRRARSVRAHRLARGNSSRRSPQQSGSGSRLDSFATDTIAIPIEVPAVPRISSSYGRCARSARLRAVGKLPTRARRDGPEGALRRSRSAAVAMISASLPIVVAPFGVEAARMRRGRKRRDTGAQRCKQRDNARQPHGRTPPVNRAVSGNADRCPSQVGRNVRFGSKADMRPSATFRNRAREFRGETETRIRAHGVASCQSLCTDNAPERPRTAPLLRQ